MAFPSILFQVLFACNFLNCLLILWTICKFIHLIPGLGPLQQREQYCIAVSSVCFRYLMLFPSPWLRVHGLPELQEAWKEMESEKNAPFIIANHNSKLDSLVITALLPRSLGPRMRSLIKLALFREPLFGGICSAVGHFPVYFKGTTEGNVTVSLDHRSFSNFAYNSYFVDCIWQRADRIVSSLTWK